MMSLPDGPWIDPKTGKPTEPFRLLIQEFVRAHGGPAFPVYHERVDDENFKHRMRGKDGVWRESASETLT